MSSAKDISNLFTRFGGRPERYQEIGRAEQARDSEARWPLLSSMGAQAAHPPAVQPGARSQPAHARSQATAPRGDQAQPTTLPDGRTEPRMPWRPAAAPVAGGPAFPSSASGADRPAPPPPVIAPQPAAAAPASPLSQFIPPRPRGAQPAGRSARAAARTAASGLAPAEAGARPAAQPAAVPYAGPAVAAGAPLVARPPPDRLGPFSAGAPSPRQPVAPLSDLFDRLSRPSEDPAASGTSTADKASGLFQKLVRR